MQKDTNLEVLLDMGLTENESRVYLAMLDLGRTTVIEISKKTGILRTTIYPTIASLKEKGLAKEVLVGLKTRFEAENPHKLEQVLNLKKEKLMDKIPDFMSLYNFSNDEGIIQYYEGKKAVKNIYTDLVDELVIDDFYYVISDLDKWNNLDRDFVEKYKDKISKIGLDAKLMVVKTPIAEQYSKFARNYDHKVAFLPDRTELETDVMITKHKLIVVQLHDPIVGMIIQNRSMIGMQKNIFEVLWKFLYKESEEA